MARLRTGLLGLAGLSVLGLSGCGSTAAAGNTTDPAAIVTAYMQAVGGGDAQGGQQFLIHQPSANEVLKGDTPASRYMAAHKGSPWQIVAVPWVPPETNADPKPTKVACLIGKPPPSQVCLVNIQVGTANPVFFRFALENRYQPDYEIISVDQVKNASDLLPTGNTAHRTV